MNKQIKQLKKDKEELLSTLVGIQSCSIINVEIVKGLDKNSQPTNVKFYTISICEDRFKHLIKVIDKFENIFNRNLKGDNKND